MPTRSAPRLGREVTVIGWGAFKIGRNEGVKYPTGYDLPTDEAAARGVLEWLSPGGMMWSGMAVPPPNPVLNVAGTRESKAPGMQQRVRDVMRLVLKPPFYVAGAE
jgi:hypothetical protein